MSISPEQANRTAAANSFFLSLSPTESRPCATWAEAWNCSKACARKSRRENFSARKSFLRGPSSTGIRRRINRRLQLKPRTKHGTRSIFWRVKALISPKRNPVLIATHTLPSQKKVKRRDFVLSAMSLTASLLSKRRTPARRASNILPAFSLHVRPKKTDCVRSNSLPVLRAKLPRTLWPALARGNEPFSILILRKKQRDSLRFSPPIILGRFRRFPFSRISD